VSAFNGKPIIYKHNLNMTSAWRHQ